jgi:hypothetical protein
MKRLTTIAILCLASFTAAARSEWKAYTEVPTDSIESVAEASFTSEKIDDALFERMYGKSYKEGCVVPRDSLCYLRLLHYDADGRVLRGEMVCHRSIAQDLLEIFREMFEVKYPIERMVLIDDYDGDDNASMDADNSSAFNYRTVSGTTKLSKHAMGLAVDINTFYNPYVKRRKDGTLYVSPEQARPYSDRRKNFRYKIEKGDALYKAFIRKGFTWGGEWRTLKDYQHFEK